ncbi:MAG: coproporphyrinogen III oxidase, partial [Proteobacteria bacterium]|nr:coproporphyrinogen III oxidase [Pseudomonadota bacterium]
LAEALTTGTVRRNFQGYTTDGASTLLGLGASAIGRLPQGYVQNATQEVAWRDAVKSQGLAVVRGVALTPDDLLRGEIIERLMCDLEVDLAAVCARHGRRVSDLEAEIRALAPAIGEGLVTLDGARLRIVDDGRLVVRSICAAFDAYFSPAAGRHAKAI